jgi:hypothetical protein
VLAGCCFVVVVVVVVVVVFDLLSFVFNGAMVQIPAQSRNSFPQNVHTNSEAHSMAIRFLLPGIKLPGRVAGHSPPSSAKDRNEWSCNSAPPLCLPGVVRDSTVFLFNGLANDK